MHDGKQIATQASLCTWSGDGRRGQIKSELYLLEISKAIK
jgi:hypothetical protein